MIEPLTAPKNKSPSSFVFSQEDLLWLIFCIVLDVSEYAVAILVMPLVGDLLDLVGILVCFIMFRWVGVISLFELVPGVDILPTFIITWVIWYFLKKRKEQAEEKRLQKDGL